MRKRKGFTLIELLVVVAIIALLISILLPSLARAREIAKRAVCAANLSSIGKAVKVYSNENGDYYPTHPFKEMNVIVTDNTNAVSWVGKMSYNLFSGWNPTTPNIDTGQIHPSRSMFLLVIDGSCTAKSFICPSSGDSEDDMRNYNGATITAAQAGTTRFDFRGYPYVSYGYQLPYGPKGRPNEILDSRMALMADKGPFFAAGSSNSTNMITPDAYGPQPGGSGNWSGGQPITLWNINNSDPGAVLKADNDRWRPYNSRNHASEGQTVLYCDGHATFERKPICGVNYENIYTMQKMQSYQLVDTLLGQVPLNQKGPWTMTDSIIVP